MAIIQSRAEIPTTWELAVECCTNATVQSLAKLGRSEAQTVVYRDAMAKIKQEYAGVGDYLKVKVFGLNTKPGPDGKRVAIDEALTERRVVWRVNDFPYNFVEGIEHHVLWCSEPMSEAEVAQHIAQRFPGKATCQWVNPVELQSVLAIWHAHVLVNTKLST